MDQGGEGNEGWQGQGRGDARLGKKCLLQAGDFGGYVARRSEGDEVALHGYTTIGMKNRVQQVVDMVSGRLQTFETVEAVTVHIGPEDMYDPAFAVVFDMYYRASLPAPAQRGEIFPDVFAFEASRSNRDRFLADDIPVRIEYKDVDRFDAILRLDGETTRAVRDTGTYSFYRLQYGDVVFSSGKGGYGPDGTDDWITDVRRRLEHLPEAFWAALRSTFRSRMEHALADLVAAVAAEEELFYLLSAGEFIRSLCSVLFAVNRRFEPPGRSLHQQTLALPILPESFRGRFDTIVRQDPEVDLDRKREIAELLARSVVILAAGDTQVDDTDAGNGEPDDTETDD